MFHFAPLPLSGAYLLTLPAFQDNRGGFIKTFQDSMFKKEHIGFTLKESYFSTSAKDVIRGMHFQTPPYQHAKIVCCPAGSIWDVIVDLRSGSPTYGQHYGTELSDRNHKAYFIPEGFAHGFKALTDGAITYYLVSSEHSKDNDSGIRYDSLGIDWECTQPIVSERDLSFVDLASYQSPF